MVRHEWKNINALEMKALSGKCKSRCSYFGWYGLFVIRDLHRRLGGEGGGGEVDGGLKVSLDYRYIEVV